MESFELEVITATRVLDDDRLNCGHALRAQRLCGTGRLLFQRQVYSALRVHEAPP